MKVRDADSSPDRKVDRREAALGGLHHQVNAQVH